MTAGGHSIEDAEPKYGLCVTGLVHPDRVLTNSGAREGDLLVLAAYPFEERENLRLSELTVERGHRLSGRTLADIASAPDAPRYLIVLIQRGPETVIPTGSTVIQPGDVLILAQSDAKPRAQAGAAEE